MEVYKLNNCLKHKDVERYYNDFFNKEVLFQFINNILRLLKKDYYILFGDVFISHLPDKFHEKTEKCNIVLINYKNMYISLTLAGKYRFDISNLKIEDTV